jgi:hypothetical protein
MISHLIRISLLIILSAHIANAQIIKGRITNPSGEPVQYSTVYIQELKQGATANVKGDYELRLPPGKYMVIYQSLGYEPIFANITVTDKTIIKDIVLPLQYYEIPEVRITASGEDPAYIIMRKVIGIAPYYLNNISYYKAEVYLKGNLVVNKIPKLLQKSMKVESTGNSTSISGGGKAAPEEKLIKEGDVYLMESFNEMEFTAPDRYVQKTISFNSTFPDQGSDISPMDFIEASFYEPVLADMAISPLSPQAFSYYKFKYLGSSLQGNFTINKIQVIPKRKSQQVFEGTIYIIEDLWCLHSVDLTNENLVGTIKVQQLYIPVQDEVWMPVSHKFDINVGIMGFKADVAYGASIKYIDVKPNLALAKPKTISTDYGGRNTVAAKTTDTIETKTKKQINAILEKDDISNRDMMKLSKLMAKESEKTLPDSTRNSLEIVDHTKRIVEKDAAKKDSAYWAAIRPIPLSEIEMKSIRVRDSIKSELTALSEGKSDTTKAGSAKQKSKFMLAVKNISTGHTWSDTTGSSFTFGGLFKLDKLRFNTVDGFVYGTDLRFSKRWKNETSLSLYPDVRWAFSRKSLIWSFGGSYNFSRLKPKQIFFTTGVASRDISTGGSINTFINSVNSLFFRTNYLKLYEISYFTTGYSSEITNGLRISISTSFEQRKALTNNTNYSIIKSSKAYTDNIPVNPYLAPGSNPVNLLTDLQHINFITGLTYTPRQKYTIRNGRKIPRGSDWPTFYVSWKHGINDFGGTGIRSKHYDMIRFDVSRRQEIGAFSEYRWRVRAGGFIDNRDITFYDFAHFNSQPIPVLLDNYQDAFMLPSYYSMSTPEFYGEAHFKYTTPYLLLKFLPGLTKTLIRENLSISYLGSRFHKNYTEIGYSLSEIFFLAELGVYVGFDDLKYRAVGAKLVLRFN